MNSKAFLSVLPFLFSTTAFADVIGCNVTSSTPIKLLAQTETGGINALVHVVDFGTGNCSEWLDGYNCVTSWPAGRRAYLDFGDKALYAKALAVWAKSASARFLIKTGSSSKATDSYGTLTCKVVAIE